MSEKSAERRDGPRIDLRLRVRYTQGSIQGEAEASDVSPKGLRLESDKAVAPGAELTLHIDVGEEDEIQVVGQVIWCRSRPSPTGKTLCDIGVRFDSNWLSGDRGPLGTALARIFAMNRYEPARVFERTDVSLRAHTSDADPIELTIGNMSLGGMQLSSRTDLSAHVKSGAALVIEIAVDDTVEAVQGKIAWVASQSRRNPADTQPGSPSSTESFGVQFLELTSSQRTLIDRLARQEIAAARITIALKPAA